MNWKAVANYVLSTAGWFLVGFFSSPFFVDGMTVKQRVAAGVTAGVASAISHVRENPFKVP